MAKKKPAKEQEKKEPCLGCGSDFYEGEKKNCPHCGNEKCSTCDMGDDVECGGCNDPDDAIEEYGWE